MVASQQRRESERCRLPRVELHEAVKEKEQECWRENLIEMVETRNGSPRGLHG